MTARRLTLYAAIAANVAIAVTKFLAAGASGSSVLFSEGLHSIVDTGDGLLLLLGVHLSHRGPTRRHPYGHGAEVYFWSMVVAMSIFGIGGGVSIYQGIEHLGSGRPPSHLGWSYLVLAIAFVFEGVSWLVSMHGFRQVRGDRGMWEAIERAKDPTTFSVILEDSAALLGIGVAAVGLALAHWLQEPIYDALGSIVIGALLVTAGIVLGRETWSLLLGESASRELVESIRAIARAQPGVLDVQPPRTMHLGPDLVHVDLDIELDASHSGRWLVDTTRRIEAAVRHRHPQVHRVSLRFPQG